MNKWQVLFFSSLRNFGQCNNIDIHWMTFVAHNDAVNDAVNDGTMLQTSSKKSNNVYQIVLLFANMVLNCTNAIHGWYLCHVPLLLAKSTR